MQGDAVADLLRDIERRAVKLRARLDGQPLEIRREASTLANMAAAALAHLAASRADDAG